MGKAFSLGETFVDGRIVNLDTAEISDLERYLKNVEKSKEISKLKLDKLMEEIKSI